MNTGQRLILVTILLCCLALPAAMAAPAMVSISSAAADTSGTPPQDAAVYLNETRAAVAGQNWTGALRVTTRGIAWYPENAELLCLQGYTLRKMGQYRQSVSVISRAILLDPKAVRYANRGYGYVATGNYSAALADAESGISLDADYSINHIVKALALQGMGNATGALAASEEAISRAPDDAHYWHVKGRILASAGDCDGSREALERSLELDAGYLLPYPGFGSASENLAGLNITCAKAAAPQATQKSPLLPIAAAGVIGAVIAFRMRK